MARYTNLATIARRTGYPVVEVAGWQSRGAGDMGPIGSVMCHHTATSRHAKGEYPSLGIVRDGVTYANGSRLPGPLSQFGLGRTGTIYVIASGRANHAGRVRYDSETNFRSLGIEAENDGLGEPWSARQLDAYHKLCAELCKAFGLPTSRVVGHKEAAVPAGRKSDPNFSMSTFRSKVDQARRGLAPAVTTPGGPVSLSAKNIESIRKAIIDDRSYNLNGNNNTLGWKVANTNRRTEQVWRTVRSLESLAAQLVEQNAQMAKEIRELKTQKEES